MTDLTTIFCEIDDFCKVFFKQFNCLPGQTTRKRNRASRLTPSEVMAITLYYHSSGYATFKDYYEKHVRIYLQGEFPNLVSYNRFIELKKSVLAPFFAFLTTRKLSRCDGYSIVDSSKLEACHIRRTYSHKTLASISKKGKTSTGWFYGLKIHLTTSYKGEILSFCITPGNVSDNNKPLLLKLTKKIFGKLFGDKGYIINAKLFQQLYNNNVKVVTKVRKNMKNKT